ncbi:MAG: class I SAM-dependent methyltransferase [Spirochaetaceae bacterium]|jgi:2-polyprenyl-3-methyl-5-hydroxy-6-metoxy-1,4-benzoquinol methylase|nr:class I SAM-dependent methyltransferase [Spirochaetaceae bacterium]
MKTFSIKPALNEKKEIIKCPVCGFDSFSKHWECDGFAYVRCRKCHLILQNPQPVFEDLDNRYSEEYFKYEQDNDQTFFDLMLKSLSDIDINPNNFDSSENRSFLDIGCATGLLVEYFQKSGWMSRGVELCSPAAIYGSELRLIDIFSGTVEQAAFKDETFDIIHCSHLIEHLNNPGSFMDEVYRILKPGGMFLCTTPNVSGFQAKLFQSKWRSSIADHMFLFSRKTLTKLFKNKNLSIRKIKTWGGLGQGYGPLWLKKVLDFSAKKLHFGDVMIISSEKNSLLK